MVPNAEFAFTLSDLEYASGHRFGIIGRESWPAGEAVVDGSAEQPTSAPWWRARKSDDERGLQPARRRVLQSVIESKHETDLFKPLGQLLGEIHARGRGQPAEPLPELWSSSSQGEWAAAALRTWVAEPGDLGAEDGGGSGRAVGDPGATVSMRRLRGLPDGASSWA